MSAPILDEPESVDTALRSSEILGECSVCVDEIEYRWAVAESFYDDLPVFRKRLALFDNELAFNYVSYLVLNKKFRDGGAVYKEYLVAFLGKLRSVDDGLLECAEEFSAELNVDAVRLLVDICKVMGDSVDVDQIRWRINIEARVFGIKKVGEGDLGDGSKVKGDVQVLSGPADGKLGFSDSCLSYFQASWMGKIYKKYLKPLPWVRSLVVFGWKRFAKVVSWLNWRQSDYLKVLSLNDYVEQVGAESRVLNESQIVLTPWPDVWPIDRKAVLHCPHEKYLFPPVYVAKLTDCVVMGGTHLFKCSNYFLSHDLIDFSKDYTSEELHGRILYNENDSTVAFASSDSEPFEIEAAASFIDALAPNYAHWLTEVLPRVAVFCSDECYASIPVLVNANLHENIMASLLSVVGSKRRVFAVPNSRIVKVKKLYCTSVVGYVPFEQRHQNRPWTQGVFSPYALNVLRDFVLPNGTEVFSEMPNKIYIRRNSQGRNIVNAKQIEGYLVHEGFTIVEPERLSFRQQVEIFSNAELVVGASGAALANMVFMKPESRVVILIGALEGTSYWYWQNISCSSQCDLHYFLASIVDDSPSIHSDFYVDKGLLGSFFDRLS